LIRGQGVEDKFVVDGWTGSAECFLLALPRPMALGDHKTIILDP